MSCGVAQLILQELAGQSTTVENYVIDFDNNAVVFSHDGHGNPALAAPGTVKVKHSIYYTGVHGFGAGFEFAYRPGPDDQPGAGAAGRRPLEVRDLRGRVPRLHAAPGLGAADAVPARHALRSPTGAPRGARPGRPTTWRRRRAAGRASSSPSPACFRSRRWSSEAVRRISGRPSAPSVQPPSPRGSPVHASLGITPPFFEVGPKAYAYGRRWSSLPTGPTR